MSTVGFISKRDWRFPDLDETFLGKDGYVYFIEHESVKEWLTREHEWTTDPLKAMPFFSEISAKTYAVGNGFSGWRVREHKTF